MIQSILTSIQFLSNFRLFASYRHTYGSANGQRRIAGLQLSIQSGIRERHANYIHEFAQIQHEHAFKSKLELVISTRSSSLYFFDLFRSHNFCHLSPQHTLINTFLFETFIVLILLSFMLCLSQIHKPKT